MLKKVCGFVGQTKKNLSWLHSAFVEGDSSRTLSGNPRKNTTMVLRAGFWNRKWIKSWNFRGKTIFKSSLYQVCGALGSVCCCCAFLTRWHEFIWGNFVVFEEKISVNVSDKEEGSVAEVENLKAGKRKLKASITSQLNELETGNWNVWKDLMKKPCKSLKS